jgi:hypothetical protein
MRPETESREGLGDSFAKAMRYNARMAFLSLLSAGVNGRFWRKADLRRSGEARKVPIGVVSIAIGAI